MLRHAPGHLRLPLPADFPSLCGSPGLEFIPSLQPLSGKLYGFEDIRLIFEMSDAFDFPLVIVWPCQNSYMPIKPRSHPHYTQWLSYPPCTSLHPYRPLNYILSNYHHHLPCPTDPQSHPWSKHQSDRTINPPIHQHSPRPNMRQVFRALDLSMNLPAWPYL